MRPLNESKIDWSGVKPDESPIAPLDAATFIERLQRLSDRAASLTILRQAFREQHSNDDQISRDSEPSTRQPR
jgi:hypothetical protein